MRAVKAVWASFCKYLYWLVFTETIFLVTELVRMNEFFRRVYWLDMLSNYALLGAAGALASVVASVLLAGIEHVGGYLHSPSVSEMPRGLVFAAFVSVWLNLLRLMLAAIHLPTLPWTPFWQMVVFLGMGATVFVLRRKRLSGWIDGTARQLKIVAWGSIVTCLALTVYFFSG